LKSLIAAPTIIDPSGRADSRLSQDGIPSKFCLSPLQRGFALGAGIVSSSFPRLLRVLCACLCTLATASAIAYRPFDSTDADVAKAGDLELELGPAGLLRAGSTRKRVEPAIVANYGLSDEREVVLEGHREVLLDGARDEPRSSIRDDALSLKEVLREGVLQDQAGPSVATEISLLLPEVHGDNGTGASVAGIVSQRNELATAHVNAALQWARKHEPGAFLGVIIEGPHAWAVRPVAELFGEQVSGAPRGSSGLVGAIWRVRDNLSFDVGVRRARSGGERVREFRAGLTWAFAIRKEP
jgi:hypothetical protein